MLGEDHARLERAFDVILAGAERGDWDDLRRRWPAFERELTRHMDAEEIRIISGFGREHPREARTLLDDHARIRAQLTELGLELETGTVAVGARARLHDRSARARRARGRRAVSVGGARAGRARVGAFPFRPVGRTALRMSVARR